MSSSNVARQRWFSTTDPKRRNALVASLFEREQRRVRRQLIRWGVEARDADDVCSEVFVVVLRRLSDYEGRSSLSTWVFGIALRRASDYRRARGVKQEDLVERLPEVEGPDSITERYERHEGEQQLRSAVSRLRPEQRDVVTRYVLLEEPMAEIAQRSRLPLQTLYARYYAAENHLRNELSPVGT